MSDATLDALIAATEHGDFSGGTPEVWRLEHEALERAGLLDPGEPTRWGHYLYSVRTQAEFTGEERALMRARQALEGSE